MGVMTWCRTRFGRPSSLATLLCVGVMAAPLSFAAPAFSRAPGHTIGLVLTSWSHALHETPGAKEECPAGWGTGENAEMAARPDVVEQKRKFGHIEARGPNGEIGRTSPMLVEDALPFSELQTKIGYGINLDGTSDGRATPKSCRHDKFTSPDGRLIDNQMARVVGCTQGWRSDGFNTEFIAPRFVTSSANRILIEITGVDDERNDPDVEVMIYKGRGGLVADLSGKFLPFRNQRIDARFPQYMHKTRGEIVDGVLITEPVAVANLLVQWIGVPGERRLRDLRLRLKLTEDGAEGLLGGYEDLKFWWAYHSKGTSSSMGVFSHGAYYRAAHRYADGYPDPETGQCTAISAAYNVTAVRAMIAHPQPEQPSRMALSSSGSSQ